MWSLLRMFLIGRLLGGRGGAAMGGARRGCGCMSLLFFIVLIVLVVYFFRSCGPERELRPTIDRGQDTYSY